MVFLIFIKVLELHIVNVYNCVQQLVTEQFNWDRTSLLCELGKDLWYLQSIDVTALQIGANCFCV